MLRFEGYGNINHRTPIKPLAASLINTGFYKRQIVTLHLSFTPFFPHTLTALAAVSLGLTARRAIRLLAIRNRRC